MATVKQHLADMHERYVKSCNARADHDEALGKLAEAAGRQQEGLHHQAKAADMRKLANYHSECAETMKTAGFEDDLSKLASSGTDALNKMIDAAVEAKVQEVLGKTLQPDKISSVIPTDVPFGIRSVPRAGQPDLTLDKAAVPPQFRHLVELGDEV